MRARAALAAFEKFWERVWAGLAGPGGGGGGGISGSERVRKGAEKGRKAGEGSNIRIQGRKKRKNAS